MEERESRDHPGLSPNGKHFIGCAGLPRSLCRTKDRNADAARSVWSRAAMMVEERRHRPTPGRQSVDYSLRMSISGLRLDSRRAGFVPLGAVLDCRRSCGARPCRRPPAGAHRRAAAALARPSRCVSAARPCRDRLGHKVSAEKIWTRRTAAERKHPLRARQSGTAGGELNLLVTFLRSPASGGRGMNMRKQAASRRQAPRG
jgi:hypothetical protein